MRVVAWVAAALLVSACGNGFEVTINGSGGYLPNPRALDIRLSLVPPHALQVQWGPDSEVSTWLLNRDGAGLAQWAASSLASTTFVDASVLAGRTYCYQVLGYSRGGLIVAATPSACATA